jgi:hypothetical protein
MEMEPPADRAAAEAELTRLCAERDRGRRVVFSALAVGAAVGLAWIAPPGSVGLWCFVGLFGFLAVGMALGFISPPKPRSHPLEERIALLERYLGSRPPG